MDAQGQAHEVWFEDARSIRAKLLLPKEYGLKGVGYWNLMWEFPQTGRFLNSMYDVRAGHRFMSGFPEKFASYNRMLEHCLLYLQLYNSHLYPDL